MKPIYLDNNATTPVAGEVVEAMLPFYQEQFGNASSVHSFGQSARRAVEDAREHVAQLIGAQAKEIVFTCGGTEADNCAVLGIAAARRDRGRHIITTAIEHPAVLRATERLEREGYAVTYLPVDERGQVATSDFESAVRKDDTILASIMYVNNETGVIQPIEEMAEIARSNGFLFHTDAVQAVGKIPLETEALGVDLLSLSAHKFHGPKGVGALFVRRGVDLEPLLLGGGHERNRRGGTENVPGIVGLGRACRLAEDSLDHLATTIRRLRDEFEMKVQAELSNVVVNGAAASRAHHVTNLSFGEVHGESLLMALDLESIAVSTGAACASGSISPSHVLVAMGLEEARVQGAIRFSLSRDTTREELERVESVLVTLVERIRRSAPTRVRP